MLRFHIPNMTCGGCASKVQSAVQAMELTQVKSCEVSVENATAVLTLADGQKVDSEAVAKAITAAGFPAKVHEAAKAEAKDQPADQTEETTSTM